jgi:hypothetical protein
MTDRATENDLTAQRVGQNQSTFRAANEEILAAAQEIAAEVRRVPFICECPDTRCTTIVRLALGEYEAIRAHGTHFAVAEGHEVCVVDGQEVARIHDRREGHTIMEKLGAAGAEARRLDPRS